MRNLLVTLLILLGGLLVSGLRLPRLSVKARAKSLTSKIEERSQQRKKKPETAREFVDRINGHKRENFAVRSYRSAQSVYDTIGQSGRYQRVLNLSLLCGAAGAGAGLLLRNVLLAVALAVGLYFLPLWLTQFTLYRYQQFLSNELETALSLVTTSYTRNNDILASIEENLKSIHDPVRGVFTSFCNNLKYVDANAPAQIERMKWQLDHPLFREWCDVLILCQDNHLLQAALPPIVGKFAVLKAQQEANATRMMLPLKSAGYMAALVTGICPILKIINLDWYSNLMHTAFGQIALSAAVIVVFATLNRAIALSRPIAYDV